MLPFLDIPLKRLVAASKQKGELGWAARGEEEGREGGGGGGTTGMGSWPESYCHLVSAQTCTAVCCPWC